MVNSYQWPSHAQLDRLERRLDRIGRTRGLLESESSETDDSIFVRLRGERRQLEVGRPGSGGGMASLGEHLLVLAHEGSIFSASSPDDVRRTAIRPPENGFEAYLAGC